MRNDEQLGQTFARGEEVVASARFSMPLHLAFLEDGELLGVLWREHEKRLKQLNFATGDYDITVPYSRQADASPDGCYRSAQRALGAA